jgi:16S rRNA (cytosine1402-N4)-methyltransferase
MTDEVLHFLRPEPGLTIVDATVGSGGHALLLYEAMRGEGRLVALDRDPEMIESARRRFAEKGIPEQAVRWVVGSFGDLREHLVRLGIETFDRILFDFGLNSEQLADPSRGFSFNIAGPLDGRFSRSEPTATLGEWLKRIRVEELERVLREEGGERWARRIARAIIRRRGRGELETTSDLAAAIRSAVPPAKGWRRIDAATRSFQALRIVTNDEGEHIARGLEQAIEGLAPNGRIVVISFHSGEDRLAKEAFRRHDLRYSREGIERAADGQATLEILTRKPVRPSESECRINPRARSARLRAARKVKSSK